jgi:Gas vesicle protein
VSDSALQQPGSAVDVDARARASLMRRGAREVTLLDLLDRLLTGGVVVQGDITLAAADIDLVDLSLRLVVGSVDSVGRDLRGCVEGTLR